MAILIGMSSEVKGKNFDINRDRVTVGRNLTNLIALEHPTVSGRHAVITRANNQYTVADLESTNGTRINSREITESVLRPRDLLQFGSLEFMFDVAEGEAVDAPPKPEPPEARVEVSSGPATAPVSFGSISPFGTRRRDNMTLWYVLIAVIGLLALAGVVVLVMKLMQTGAGGP